MMHRRGCVCLWVYGKCVGCVCGFHDLRDDYLHQQDGELLFMVLMPSIPFCNPSLQIVITLRTMLGTGRGVQGSEEEKMLVGTM